MRMKKRRIPRESQLGRFLGVGLWTLWLACDWVRQTWFIGRLPAAPLRSATCSFGAPCGHVTRCTAYGIVLAGRPDEAASERDGCVGGCGMRPPGLPAGPTGLGWIGGSAP